MASMMATVATVGLSNGNTIVQKVRHLEQPSMLAASSSSFGTFVLIAPWNMNTARETEKPVCMRISVIRLFNTSSKPP